MKRSCLIAIAVTLVWMARPCTAQQSVVMAAEGKQLWRVTYDDAENVTQVALRHKRVWRDIATSRGRAEALCAAGGRLHAFYRGAGYTQYLPGGGAALGDVWPIQWREYRVLAACKGAGDPHNPDIYLLLARPAPATTQATTDPAPATQPSVPPPVLLVYRGGTWELVGEIDPLDHTPTDVYQMTTLGDRGLYLLACSAERWPKALLRFADGAWTSLAIDDAPPGQRIRWLLALTDDLLLAGTADDGSWLRRIDPTTGAPGPIVPITRDGKPMVFAPDAANLCPFGLTVVATWRDDDAWQVGSIDLKEGDVTNVEDLSLPGVADGKPFGRWLEAFLLAIVVLLAIGLFQRFKKGTSEAFELPAELKPASWPLRIAAAAIDAIPFVVAGFVLMGLSPDEWAERFKVMTEADEIDNRVVGALLIASGGLVIYSMLMEWRFGATVGKRVLKMRVVGSGGGRATPASILVRNVTKCLELMWPMIILWMVWPHFTRYRQRIGDMLAGTAVVMGRPSPAEQPPEPPTFDGDQGGPPPPPPE